MNNNQELLNLIERIDKFEFLKNVQNWDSHRPLLLLALELTKGDVLELGSGSGSTPFLKNYCEDTNRNFYSYDSNKEWAEKMNTIYIEDWDKSGLFDKDYSVCFIDHAPGEHRHIAIRKLFNHCSILVVHDSEPDATGYMLNDIFPLFRYRLDYRTSGAWATALSNDFNLDEFDNCTLGKFLLQKG